MRAIFIANGLKSGVAKMVAINMEIPSCCGECNLTTCKGKDEPWNYCCSITLTNINLDNTERPSDCPLVEIEERKVGKWIVKDNGNGGIYVECPFCGALAPCTEFADRIVWKYSNFCYDCGNELRGNENE